jgi:hypothetical protein
MSDRNVVTPLQPDMWHGSTRRHSEQTRSRDENGKTELERRLDRALEETFPASDPVSIIISL